MQYQILQTKITINVIGKENLLMYNFYPPKIEFYLRRSVSGTMYRTV